MLKVVEEQPSVALRFLCLIGDYKVGTSKQYISQIIDSNDIPNLGESMLIASNWFWQDKCSNQDDQAHLNAGHLCDQQKDDALSVQKDYIKASKGLDVPAELLDSISLGGEHHRHYLSRTC